ncbi:MAG: hypothetical protein ACD_15C00110G0006 [uncultured bacterium]|nr:MAG: hypothetical protein ACD_15C00110G0006 [uncultured bacterium]HCU70652.1 hypothetical protein [Candidatus Moranbacteria bacterium]
MKREAYSEETEGVIGGFRNELVDAMFYVSMFLCVSIFLGSWIVSIICYYSAGNAGSAIFTFIIGMAVIILLAKSEAIEKWITKL